MFYLCGYGFLVFLYPPLLSIISARLTQWHYHAITLSHCSVRIENKRCRFTTKNLVDMVSISLVELSPLQITPTCHIRYLKSHNLAPFYAFQAVIGLASSSITSKITSHLVPSNASPVYRQSCAPLFGCAAIRPLKTDSTCSNREPWHPHHLPSAIVPELHECNQQIPPASRQGHHLVRMVVMRLGHGCRWLLLCGVRQG